jgi:hypothetical protein
MRSVGFLGFDEREKGGNLRKSICGLYTGHANVGIAEQYFKTAIERKRRLSSDQSSDLC